MNVHPYDNQFAEDNVYGHAVKLLARFSLPRGSIHLDFGCGFGHIAEVIRDRFGLHYVGLDILQPGLDSLIARGFETIRLDLRNPDEAVAMLQARLPADVAVASMSFLDTLEHLAEPEKALELLHRVADQHRCPLVMSVPNVAHRDIAMKLLAGQFEYTESGLLDQTHYQYFTERTLTDRMAAHGWYESQRNDVLMESSDQDSQPNQPLLSAGTPINSLLRYLRRQADATDTVNQFVRAYLAAAPRKQAVAETGEAPFLSVVTRTQGERIETLRETLLCLSAQTCQDFEVLVIGHKLTLEQQLKVERVIADTHESMRNRTRLVKVDRGERAAPLNAAFEAARGEYVSVLDDDDLVFGNWVECFKALHADNPGKILRATAVSQTWDKTGAEGQQLATRCNSGFRSEYPEQFDLFDHLIENRSPLHSLSFPRSLTRDLHFRFDETLTTAEDWDFIIRTAPITGVAGGAEITCIYRRWDTSDHSEALHDQSEWKANYQHSLRKMDATPLLLPAGYTRRVRELLHEVDRLRQGPVRYHISGIDPKQSRSEADYLEVLRWRLFELVNSRTWRYTAFVRRVKSVFTGERSLPPMTIWRFNQRELEDMIVNIERSRTWRSTHFLRKLVSNRRAKNDHSADSSQ